MTMRNTMKTLNPSKYQILFFLKKMPVRQFVMSFHVFEFIPPLDKLTPESPQQTPAA